jgi:hypothetical protein
MADMAALTLCAQIRTLIDLRKGNCVVPWQSLPSLTGQARELWSCPKPWLGSDGISMTRDEPNHSAEEECDDVDGPYAQ